MAYYKWNDILEDLEHSKVLESMAYKLAIREGYVKESLTDGIPYSFSVNVYHGCQYKPEKQ